jgi:hypothetical protein
MMMMSRSSFACRLLINLRNACRFRQTDEKPSVAAHAKLERCVRRAKRYVIKFQSDLSCRWIAGRPDRGTRVPVICTCPLSLPSFDSVSYSPGVMKLVTYAGPAAAHASGTRTGGVPLTPLGFEWPRCKRVCRAHAVPGTD